MLLEPDKVEFFDLIRMLFSTNLENRKFLDCPPGTTSHSFTQRWLILLSVLVQKLLLKSSKYLAWLGSMIEHWLNLLTLNHGFFRLLINLLQGKVVAPDVTSASYMSFNGYIDSRIEHDEDIKHGDCRYNAALAVMASKLSYENKSFIQHVVNDQWQMEFLGHFDFWNEYQEKATTQAFIFKDNPDDNSDTIVVAFRGTEPFDADAWSTDVDISWYELPHVGKVHGGFMKALGLQRNLGWPKEVDQLTNSQRPKVAYYAIREMLRELLKKNDKAKFVVTGHSLGGALAILFPAVLIMHEEDFLLERLEGIYTFGQPRVGDENFGNYMKEKMKKMNIQYYRFVYGYDLVPRLPYDDSTMMFKHFGTCVYYDCFYDGKIVEEEPNKNYFSLLYFIPKTMTATWEFIRSFTIGYTRGAKYYEGGVLRCFRMFGLLVLAGLPAHCCQDYVNAIRLGSPQVFLANGASQITQKPKTN